MNPNSPAFALLIAFGGVFFGTGFFFVGRYLWREGRELRREGVGVRATILQKINKGGWDGNGLRCAFRDAAGAHEVELTVSSKLWHQIRENGTVPLTLLPGQLETVRVGSPFGWKLRGVIGLGMMAVGVLAGFGFLIGGLWEAFMLR